MQLLSLTVRCLQLPSNMPTFLNTESEIKGVCVLFDNFSHLEGNTHLL